MKIRCPFFRPFAAVILIPVAVWAANAPVKPSVPNPLAPRFQQVREKITTLYEHRNETPPPPDPALNPFRTASIPGPALAAGAPTMPGGATTETLPATDLTLLQQSVATLRVSGVFEISGRSHLVINARPYQQGDVVQTQVRGETVYLRVREITAHSVTLVLNDAEMTLKF